MLKMILLVQGSLDDYDTGNDDEDNDDKNEDDIVGTGMPGAGWPNTPPHFRSYEGEPPFLILPS